MEAVKSLGDFRVISLFPLSMASRSFKEPLDAAELAILKMVKLPVLAVVVPILVPSMVPPSKLTDALS